MSENKVHRRVGLVTGAGRGLGRAHAIDLAKQGMVVVVNDTGALLDGASSAENVAQSVADEISAAGGTAIVSTDDVSTHEGAAAAVAVALDNFGRLDVVVNNAGILRDRTFGKMSLDDFDAVIRGHLGGSAYVTHAAWEALGNSGTGRVIFTSSASGLYGQFGQANYASAKAAMVGLVNVLKQEGERSGIKVNAIAPAARTRMTEELLPPESLGGLGPDLVSPVVSYLASEECDISGWIIEVAAGLVARVQVTETATVPIYDSEGNQNVTAAIEKLQSAPAGSPYPTSSDALARYVAAAAASQR